MKVTLVGFDKEDVEIETLEVHMEEQGHFFLRMIDKQGRVVDTGFIMEST